jgi:hypothetical protein
MKYVAVVWIVDRLKESYLHDEEKKHIEPKVSVKMRNGNSYAGYPLEVDESLDVFALRWGDDDGQEVYLSISEISEMHEYINEEQLMDLAAMKYALSQRR